MAKRLISMCSSHLKATGFVGRHPTTTSSNSSSLVSQKSTSSRSAWSASLVVLFSSPLFFSISDERSQFPAFFSDEMSLFSAFLSDKRSSFPAGRSLFPAVRNDVIVLGRPMPVSWRLGYLSWTLLNPDLLKQNGNNESHRAKMTQALNILRRCFGPSIHLVAREAIFKEESNFYTAVLENKEGKVIAVAILRVHDDVAEAPLVATADEYRKIGLCKVLMGEVESWLRDRGVERLVLPSMKSRVGFWISNYMGFEAMTEDVKRELPNDVVVFLGSVMCQKQLIVKKAKEEDRCETQKWWFVRNNRSSTI